MRTGTGSMRYLLAVAVLVAAGLAGCVATAPIASTSTGQAGIGSAAEWYPARKILMHTPGQEIFLGVVHPDAALFERAFGIEKAAAQHRGFIQRLKDSGATVHTVTEVLLEGTQDRDGNPQPGPELDALRAFAADFLVIDASALPPELRGRQTAYKQKTLEELSPEELVAIILRRPTVHLRATGTNTGLSATYEMSPVMNLYFCRDQMITTARGVVLCKMNSSQRAPETRIMRFVLGKLGIEPIWEVTGQGRLEGGDFLPAGDYALIGQGLRTNAEGVRQLLEHQVFGTPYVAVVKDSWKNQEQMHLDTYFNIVGQRLAVLVADRLRQPGFTPRPEMTSKVDLYQLTSDGYQLQSRDLDFQQFVEETLQMKLLPVPAKDQLRYGVNFLAVRGGRILAIDGVSQAYKDELAREGVQATWMDFSALTGGYGAAHCCTQVLHRDGPAPGR